MNIDEEPLNSMLMFMNVPNLYTYKDIYNIYLKSKDNLREIIYNVLSESYSNKNFIEEFLKVYSAPGMPKHINYIINYMKYLSQLSNNDTLIDSKSSKLKNVNNKKRGYIVKYISKYISKNEEIRILGKTFVENNQNKGYIIYKNKKYMLKEKFKIKEKRNILKIHMIFRNDICNLSEMFKDCYNLLSFDEIKDFDNDNFFEENFELDLFNIVQKEDKILISNKNISSDKHGYTCLNSMFYNCISLKSLPDLSYWNTEKVQDISKMFYKCSSLNSLPDISKWNTRNIITMSGLFCGCKLLKVFPDLSKWQTNNLVDISGIFAHCYSLLYLPNISLWDTSKVKDMSGMFYLCNSLQIMADISNWNTENVINMSTIFSGCISLVLIPDISRWKTNSVTNMCGIFDYCDKLTFLPDISKWNINNVTV